MSEELSPDLEELKTQIEDDAGVDKDTKETLPGTFDGTGKVADAAGVAMSKAKEVMAGVAEKDDGVTDETEGGEEVSLDAVAAESSDSPTPENPTEETPAPIDYSSYEPTPAEPVVADVATATPMVTTEMRAEAREEFSLNQKVAAMLPAEYEAWLFPDMGVSGYHEGQVTLARVLSNLISAGYNAGTLGYDPVIYPRIVQIAASTWSQGNYRGCNLEETREQLTLAPANQIVDVLPAMDKLTPDLLANSFPAMVTTETEVVEIETSQPASWIAPALIGGATLTALILPIYMVRKTIR